MKMIQLPVDEEVPAFIVEVDNAYPTLTSEVYIGGWIERVRLGISLEGTRDAVGAPLDLVMIVDEQGHLLRKPVNNRASLFYGGSLGIAGTAMFCCEGWRDDPEDEDPGVDFFGLPEDFDTVSLINLAAQVRFMMRPGTFEYKPSI